MNKPVDLGEADPRSYVRLAARLRKQILQGELKPGHAVPSITVLSQELGHARQTCSKALQQLVNDGLLFRVPGLGYHVSRRAREGVQQENERALSSLADR